MGLCTSSCMTSSRPCIDEKKRVAPRKLMYLDSELSSSILDTKLLDEEEVSGEGTCQACLNIEELLRPTKACKHENAVCKMCIHDHLKNILSGGSGNYNDSIDRIRCLVDKCYATFSVKDLELHLSKVEFEKWNDLVSKSNIEKLDEFRWCTSNCGSGQLVEGGENANTFFTCQACFAKTCVKHRVAMHTGLTCKDYDQMLKNAKNQQIKSEHWKKCNTKSCPKCNIPIEKNDGCDHMTCGKCKHEFCWLCLEDYKMIKRGDNSLHKRSCKYYR